MQLVNNLPDGRPLTLNIDAVHVGPNASLNLPNITQVGPQAHSPEVSGHPAPEPTLRPPFSVSYPRQTRHGHGPYSSDLTPAAEPQTHSYQPVGQLRSPRDRHTSQPTEKQIPWLHLRPPASTHVRPTHTESRRDYQGTPIRDPRARETLNRERPERDQLTEPTRRLPAPRR